MLNKDKFFIFTTGIILSIILYFSLFVIEPYVVAQDKIQGPTWGDYFFMNWFPAGPITSLLGYISTTGIAIKIGICLDFLLYNSIFGFLLGLLIYKCLTRNPCSRFRSDKNGKAIYNK